jgi:hypothetical protein
MNIEPLRDVFPSERLDWIVRHRGRRWHVGQRPTIGPAELKRAVRPSLNRESLLVDGSVMPATQQRQVREGCGATVRPVTEVMPLPERQSTAWEATGTIARVERAPQRGRNRARRAPTSTTRPSGSCLIITRLASYAWGAPLK